MPSVELLELAGQHALSDFRLRKLTRALQRQDKRVSRLEARYVYFISLSSPPSKEDKLRLTALLLSGEKAGKIAKRAQAVYVVPRPGTISPWSSKASDIAKACDLECVARIERGICYAISFKGAAGQADAFNLAPLLFDRMTEAVLGTGDEAELLFEKHEPAAPGIVALGDNGRAALEAANVDLGLALSDDEINYLVRKYREFSRDPTDAELMMFAQANSEHCRHKIFNASWSIDGEAMDEQLFGMIRSTTDASPDRGGHGRMARSAADAVFGKSCVRILGRADSHRDESGNAQPPDSNFSVSRRCDRVRR